jgi:hypothetical protein
MKNMYIIDKSWIGKRVGTDLQGDKWIESE